MVNLEQYKGTKKIDDIEVSISYKIIELFSAGLYSSPNKAFEELICNSYDAGADMVSVYVSPDLAAEDAFIWVCDNGSGLNAEDLKNLWKIGESSKRSVEAESGGRLPIGRFGIGKLSTYILTRNLTYISKKDGTYLLVTMDYNRIKSDTEKILLDEMEISEDSAKNLVQKFTQINGKNMVAFSMFGPNSEPSWTLSILTDLKPKAAEIKEGRLKWILRSALPLNPGFILYYNCDKIESSKVNTPVMKEWIIGKEDATAEALDFAKPVYEQKTDEYSVDFESLKNVKGSFTLYEDSLLGGKSADYGRSHGIFLSIRGRLINLDDPLLGMEPFSHGPFNRCRIMIDADGLDENLTSTRESVKDSKPLNELKEYIKKKFNNEVRKYYFENEEQKEKRKSVGYRLSQTGYTTSRKPIYKFIEKFYAHEIANPFLIEKPTDSTIDELLPQYDDVEEETQVIEHIDWGILGSQAPIAKLNLKTKTVTINSLHPYIANYSDAYRSTLPLESLVLTEVLTEAHLYELGIDETDVHAIMKKRDETFRQLALSDRESLPAAAQLLHDSVANPTGLEDAIYRALLSLGFEAQKIGGNGKPDGYAEACLGYNQDGTSKNYSLTYDAKSTQGKRIAAGTAKLSGLKRHQIDYNATYSMEIAIGYAGEEDPESAITKEANQQKVTILSVQDLARLLLYAVPKQLGLAKLQELFETCYAPADTKAWIDKWIEEEPDKGPYFDMVDVVYSLQKEDRETPTIEVVRLKINEKLKTTYPTAKIKTYAEALKNMVPGQFHYDGKYVSVDCSPEVMKRHITNAINSDIPVAMRDIYNAMFSNS